MMAVLTVTTDAVYGYRREYFSDNYTSCFKACLGDFIVMLPYKSAEENVFQLIVGALIGALFAAGLLSLFAYARRDLKRFKMLIMSFLLNEARLICTCLALCLNPGNSVTLHILQVLVIISICCEFWECVSCGFILTELDKGTWIYKTMSYQDVDVIPMAGSFFGD